MRIRIGMTCRSLLPSRELSSRPSGPAFAPDRADLEDHALFDAWQRGDCGAAGELVRRHDATIRRFLERRVGESVDDVAQDVWIAIASCGARFERRASFRSYLLGVARNKAREARRQLARRRRHFSLDDAPSIGSPLFADERVDPHVELERRRLAELLDRGAETLCPETRQIIELYYCDRLSAREVALRIGVVENTARSRVVRATKKLQLALR